MQQQSPNSPNPLEEALPHLKTAHEKLAQYHRQILHNERPMPTNIDVKRIASFFATLDNGHSFITTLLAQSLMDEQRQNPSYMNAEHTKIDPFPMAAILLKQVLHHLETIPLILLPAMPFITAVKDKNRDHYTDALLDAITRLRDSIKNWRRQTNTQLKAQLQHDQQGTA